MRPLTIHPLFGLAPAIGFHFVVGKFTATLICFAKLAER